jgi:uncharacterized protein YihD (DUF1040 family)
LGLSKEQREILKLLRKLWEANPDQRLGQILENYIFFEGQRGDKTSCSLFYQEDSRTLTVLKALSQNNLKKVEEASKRTKLE